MTTDPHTFTPDHWLIELDSHMQAVLIRLNDEGFKPLIIGGAVRDALLGITPKDIDIEVYNVSCNDLSDILHQYGKVDIVGKSFGILKFSHNVDYENGKHIVYDFSIPRKENKIGVGHKEFQVTFDTSMTIKEAGARRDVTFNALAYDPLHNIVYDYFGGLDDLKNKIIRHTSDNFKEDALRILRIMQFQARFNFKIHPDTIQEIRNMLAGDEFDTLPKERVFEEFMKWAEKGMAHHLVFYFLRDTGLIDRYPELKALRETPQDKVYHMEGDVEIHTILTLKVLDELIRESGIVGQEKAILVMAMLLHDIAKPVTTEEQMKKGRMTITSHGHEAKGAVMAREFLTRLGFREDLMKPICNLIADHLASVNIDAIEEDKGKIKAIKKLSRRLAPATIDQLKYIIMADHNGRLTHGYKQPVGLAMLLIQAQKIEVQNKPYQYILMGRHLIEEGLVPSDEFGIILGKANEAQENGEFNDLEGAKKWLVTYIENERANLFNLFNKS